MEGCCLYRFIKIVNESSFYENGGGCVQQSNDSVREFHLHLSDSNLKNDTTTTSYLYKLLASMFEKKQMIRGGTTGDKTEICKKQYMCSIYYYRMSFLSK